MRGVTSAVRFRADALCSTCHGSGAAPGTLPETCPECHGSGSIAVDQGPFSFSQVCPQCGGRGQIVKDKCKNCKGRGVEVRIMVSGIRNDNWLARHNSVRLFGRLLAAGVEIQEYNRTMLHHKTMVVDGQ